MERIVTAVYDANILYPAPLRDLFVRLAQSGIVRAKWTEIIHDEWIRNVLKNDVELTREKLARTRNLMNEAVRDCLVIGHEEPAVPSEFSGDTRIGAWRLVRCATLLLHTSCAH